MCDTHIRLAAVRLEHRRPQGGSRICDHTQWRAYIRNTNRKWRLDDFSSSLVLATAKIPVFLASAAHLEQRMYAVHPVYDETSSSRFSKNGRPFSRRYFAAREFSSVLSPPDTLGGFLSTRRCRDKWKTCPVHLLTSWRVVH